MVSQQKNPQEEIPNAFFAIVTMSASIGAVIWFVYGLLASSFYLSTLVYIDFSILMILSIFAAIVFRSDEQIWGKTKQDEGQATALNTCSTYMTKIQQLVANALVKPKLEQPVIEMLTQISDVTGEIVSVLKEEQNLHQAFAVQQRLEVTAENLKLYLDAKAVNSPLQRAQ